ncbi:hypothetical protein F3Y22_tig00002942pilonHSYRG00017 [Hibiscus syriacus]|uniref:Uncharacterized protein n=1 Tax=Hibiscus syriacus TaxID=106335 RepID=A0A6A3CPN5_HIBSY|nr:hypothetical protein F3Y22_tig00002942pilonHSYRG00017 [Hibiscus syriacus]
MEHSSMWRACASKRAFRIGVLCAILTPVAKVMAKRLKHTQNDPNEEHVTINSRLCADLPTHGISAPSTCNLTAQHHLSRISLHQELLGISRTSSPFLPSSSIGIMKPLKVAEPECWVSSEGNSSSSIDVIVIRISSITQTKPYRNIWISSLI